MKKYDSRKEAILAIKKEHPNALFVSSAGLLSRELYGCSDSPKNFYMMGSMGSALPFAIGISLNCEKDVVVLVGDGEMLMGMPSLVTLNQARREGYLLGNIYLYIFDNKSYESTGGQMSASYYVSFESICECWVITYGPSEKPPRIDMEHKNIYNRFKKELREKYG